MIHWLPASGVPQRIAAGFQDGAGTGTSPADRGCVDAGRAGGEPAGCAAGVPQAVRRAWHLASCAALEATSAAPSSSAAAPRGGAAAGGRSAAAGGRSAAAAGPPAAW